MRHIAALQHWLHAECQPHGRAAYRMAGLPAAWPGCQPHAHSWRFFLGFIAALALTMMIFDWQFLQMSMGFLAAGPKDAQGLRARRAELRLLKRQAIEQENFEEAARVRDALKMLDVQLQTLVPPDSDEDVREADEDPLESDEALQPVPKLTGQGCSNSGPAPDTWFSNTQRPCGARLNFLFMVYDSINQVDVWKDFFEDAPNGSWTAWVHCSNRSRCRGDFMKDKLGPALRIVETVRTRYCVDLVTAEAQLMLEALNKTAQNSSVNERYVLVSESTLPAKPFALVYRQLTSHEESDFCFSNPSYWPVGFFQYVGTKVERGGNQISLLPRHSQFAILNSADASTFSSRWKAFDKAVGFVVPLTGKRWIRRKWGLPKGSFTYSMDFSSHFDQSIRWQGICTDEAALFAVTYGPFEPGEWKGPCPLNHSVKCNGVKSLMWQKRCRTLSVSGNDNVFVAQLQNDSDTMLLFPKHGHGIKILKLGNASLKRIRSSPWLFIRKFLPSSNITHYSDRVLRV